LFCIYVYVNIPIKELYSSNNNNNISKATTDLKAKGQCSGWKSFWNIQPRSARCILVPQNAIRIPQKLFFVDFAEFGCGTYKKVKKKGHILRN
jgi:hypothetical protein